ncbi:MAG TPA: multicopper oxidase domain-containing protein [Blastocatellia bacterium]|nr:multicopper oxidase domain-containing protein [Blastocatellia bacterium]
MNKNRRNFLRGSALLGAGLLAGTKVAAQHQHHTQQDEKKTAAERPDTQSTSREPVLVHTPDLPKLPWTMENGVKVFHLVAEPVRCEFLPESEMGPARVVDAWGYNGNVPGPTIEVKEGDRVRINFHNKLPEPTTVHWHGLEVPLAMDGVPGISQPLVEPGGKFTYEFSVNQNGTFFYHSHGAMQEMLGMVGFFIIHPKQSHQPRVDKDFGVILQEWAILPNNTVPNTLSMEFNWLTLNGKAGPATTPMIVKLGERVRIRFVNLGMDHHPMHLHGNQFYVTGTEGGRIPESAWYPGNTVLVGVAQARDVEFVARHPGDWMLHCHLPHHMMNQMVSMVGPMAHLGHGMHTGMGMEEGMGVVRQGHALSEDLGPGLGRGMGMTTREKSVSNLVGQTSKQEGPGVPPAQAQPAYACPMHPEVRSDKPGSCPKCGMTLVLEQAGAKRVPGYPQDMWMPMDEAVVKPETYGLPPGWTGAMMGMMTLVRVLPPDKYEEVMTRVKEGRTEAPKKKPEHKHDDERA